MAQTRLHTAALATSWLSAVVSACSLNPAARLRERYLGIKPFAGTDTRRSSSV